MARRVGTALGLAVLLAAVAVVAVKRRGQSAASVTELLPYQGWASALPAVEQERFTQIRASIRDFEKQRAQRGKWPESPGWTRRIHGLYANYLSVPSEPARLRWLVLFIEPEPAAIKDKAPPEDEEHHTLADGTTLHVSVWSAPDEGAAPQEVIPFPAAENWTQRLGNR